MSFHQPIGDAIMNGMFGRKNAETVSPTDFSVCRNRDSWVSCHRRIRRNGTHTTAICFAAIARPRVTQLALGRLYQNIAVSTRKKAQMLSVQPPAMTAGNNPKGARLMLLNFAGASANI